MIPLQFCDGFGHTWVWISHRHACVCPSWARLPPHPPLQLRLPPLPIHPSSSSQHCLWVPCVTRQAPLALFYFRQCVCSKAVPSDHPTLSFSHWVLKSVLYVHVSFAALHLGSSVPSFEIPYICVNIQYLSFSFWLTSLCITGSMFIHLIRTDSDVLLFMAE